jgi:phage terminase Nu1 subunit (DNA packaging protein)
MSSPDVVEPPGRLLTKQELAWYVNRTPRTVDNYVRQGMPYIPCGGGKRFHLPSVIEWLESQRGGGSSVVAAA